MKLTTAFLVLCVALLSQCTEAFFLPWRANPEATTAAALNPVAPTAAAHKPVVPNPVALKPVVPNPVALKPVVPNPAVLKHVVPNPVALTSAVASSSLKRFNPLSFLLASLGIPVEHLVEGSRKCVTELGPEAVGAVKALLGVLTFFG